MSHSVMKLVLIDDDRVFRLGLRLWLNQFPDLEVVSEAEEGGAALDLLKHYMDGQSAAEPTNLDAAAIALVILNLSLGQANPAQMQGLTLCQQIKATYPDLPVLLLSSVSEPIMIAAAQQAGADGFCLKTSEAVELRQAIHSMASGQPYWMQAARPPEPVPDSPAPSPPPPPVLLPGPLAIMRRRLRLAGLRQIDATLGAVTEQLQQNLDLSALDRAVLAGRHRELRTARWLVQRLLATPGLAAADEQLDRPGWGAIAPPPSRVDTVPSPETTGAILPSRPLERVVTARSLQAVLFDTVLSKLQISLSNQSETPLEIDSLREDKKRELLYLILRKIEDLLDELRYSQIQSEQLIAKRSLILFDLWQAVTIDFFGRYYTVTIQQTNVEVVSVLLQDVGIVQTDILNKIPFVPELLAHLLFQTPLVVDGLPYVAGNPEAMVRAEALLDNLMIQLANAVIQPLLNRFSTIEVIKQTFYDRHLMSSREIERFRNDLSWRYRLERYVGDPKDVFESQYRLFIFYGNGIKRIAITAPRNQELEQLTGIQLVVTLALETRDAIAPRLRSAISVVGSGLVYILTEVVGRGIGLVGRGILKGIGNAWQDRR